MFDVICYCLHVEVKEKLIHFVLSCFDICFHHSHCPCVSGKRRCDTPIPLPPPRKRMRGFQNRPKLFMLLKKNTKLMQTQVQTANSLAGWLGFAWLSQFVSCVIATERCACVVIPFLAQRFLKTSTMCAIIFLAAVLLVGAMAIIVATKQEYKCVYDVTTGKTSMALFLTR